MTKQVNRAADTVFPGAGIAADEANNAVQSYLPDPGALPKPNDNALASDPEVARNATEQVAERQKQLKAAAVAAGVTRSGNDVDLLGTAPRRAASRALLGSR